MDLFIEKASTIDQTLRLQDVLGKRVLAKSGTVLGRVKAVHLNQKNYSVEGIVIRKLFTDDKYVCITYIQTITARAVILSVEPSTLFEGCAVVSHDGKKIGKVKKIHRVGDTNAVASMTVSYGWFRTREIPADDIEHYGTSIILAKTHEQVKRGKKSKH